MKFTMVVKILAIVIALLYPLTISPLLTPIVPYTNSLDLNEMRSNSALLGISLGSNLYETQTTFSPTLSDIEAL